MNIYEFEILDRAYGYVDYYVLMVFKSNLISVVDWLKLIWNNKMKIHS